MLPPDRTGKVSSMFHDPDFTPFEPRSRPSYRAGVRNFLENLPPAAYRERLTVLPGLWPLVSKTIFLTDPECIEEMLVSRAEFFTRDRMTVRSLPAINRGSLFFAEGAHWKWQRRAAAPAFRQDSLLALVPIFEQCARAQAEAWRKSPPGVPVDVMDAMSRTTFAVIECTALGEADSIDREKFLAALRLVLASVAWRRTISLFNLPSWTPYPGYFKARAATTYLESETVRAITARRTKGSDRRDILDLLLSAKDSETGRVMTDAELTGNLYSFLIAGHETSAVALAWSLWLLAKDHASQDRLREEVVQVAGLCEIGSEEAGKLAFTQQVIQESMRLFPPAGAIGRQAREDTTLGPYKISKHEPIYVAIWCLHRHEKLWEEPNAFDPDRFVKEKTKARHRYAYLPFGAGPRICIGMGFAMLEMTVILATLVRDFRFKTLPCHRMALDVSLTTRPRGGLPLLVEAI
jgi:cytochrome P450